MTSLLPGFIDQMEESKFLIGGMVNQHHHISQGQTK